MPKLLKIHEGLANRNQIWINWKLKKFTKPVAIMRKRLGYYLANLLNVSMLIHACYVWAQWNVSCYNSGTLFDK